MTIDVTDPIWLEIKQWAETQIKDAHTHLERWPTPPGQDDIYRGRIALARDLLNLPKVNKPAVIPESPNYHV